MAKPLSPEQREEWKKKIEEQKTSDLPIKDWCRAQKVSVSSFYYWKNFFFPPKLERTSFSELLSSKKCVINIDYRDVQLRLEAASLSQCLTILEKLKC